MTRLPAQVNCSFDQSHLEIRNADRTRSLALPSAGLSGYTGEHISYRDRTVDVGRMIIIRSWRTAARGYSRRRFSGGTCPLKLWVYLRLATENKANLQMFATDA
jgi:hypothetical protein